MMRKETLRYYFSVEGQTEKWYFEWLEKQINNSQQATMKVKFIVKNIKNPLKYVKTMNVVSQTPITHVFDFEESAKESDFQTTLGYMRAAERKTKKVKYHLGYTNLCFELWIILHKKKYMISQSSKNNYLKEINSLFNESFESLLEYKNENNFKKILNKLTLNDVMNAVKNAKNLELQNEKNGYASISFKKYRYRCHNPSLNLHECIEKVLMDAEIL